MCMKLKSYFLLAAMLTGAWGYAREYHVAKKGNDDNKGNAERPFLTIAAANRVARAGDTITVHAGVYRERVDPLFGGTSDANRILYRAAPGEEVYIKGSEQIREWKQVTGNVWKVTIAASFFGDYNPYQTLVDGDWFLPYGRKHHTGEVYLNGRSLYEIDSLEKLMSPRPLPGAQQQQASMYQWYCESNSASTTIWANFQGADPNGELVEINVRPTVFYPRKTGMNHITVRGFHLAQAANNWAPPTAEQVGLIGPNWSKGWIIEDNFISDAKCSGISLGKDRSTGENYAAVYKKKDGHISQLESVFNGLKNGWTKENVGSHIIRNNRIYNCEQTGICGNLGAVFSQIYGNEIFDIYTKRQWGGFEMAGIKLHAPIDVIIRDNSIHNSFKGLWMDWQAQGLRVTGNVLYDNTWMDFHLEVSHGPHIIDNNCFLSDLNLWNISTGSAFIHNLFAGQICKETENSRFTPYHFPHSTHVAGIMTTQGGDDRYYNNLFIKTPAPAYDIFENARRPKRKKGVMDYGLGIYNDFPSNLPSTDFYIAEMSQVKLPVMSANNVYLEGAIPLQNGKNEKIIQQTGNQVKIEKRQDGIYLVFNTTDDCWVKDAGIISSSNLGEALVPESAFENPDGSAVLFSKDYLYTERQQGRISAGPFTKLRTGVNSIKLWPKQ
jgi:alpha-N-arabinofuranosidase